jgi:CRISPR-associated protein Cmr3
LKTIGPFPAKGDAVYLPCPLDLGMKLVALPKGQTDLPAPLTYAFLPQEEGRRTPPQWIPGDLYLRYLRGEAIEAAALAPIDDDALYAPDRNLGIALDPETGTTVDGKRYQAEYLRLQEGVSLAFQAECLVKARGGNGSVRDLFMEDWTGGNLVMGGQQGVVRVERAAQALALPPLPDLTTPHLRWTLLAPAVFKAGWRPGWVQDGGAVALRRNVARNPGEPRHAWKARQNEAPFLEAKLVAARVGKPEAFSGWNQQEGRPKPTQLAVPAGSSYVFDCGSVENAALLAVQLHLKPRSDDLGEKGHGVGVCSSVQI